MNKVFQVLCATAIAPTAASCGSGSSVNNVELFPVKIGDSRGYVNRKGEIVINPQFDNALPFTGNPAPVKMGKQWGFIDKQGKYVINPRFDNINEEIVSYMLGSLIGYVTSDYFSAEDVAAAFDFASPEGLTADAAYNDVMRIFKLSESSFNKYRNEYKAISGRKIGTKWYLTDMKYSAIPN